MKKITFLFLFIFTIGFSQVNNYQVGDTIDDFTVTDIHGVEHNLYSITAQGKYVWLDFFFVDCGPCRSTVKYFNEFYDKYGCNAGEVYCLSINLGNDSNDYVEWYEGEFGGPFNHAPAASGEGGCGPVTSNFGINAFPTFCMIGPDNTLIARDIWPVSSAQSFENSFPAGFEPEVIECSLGVAQQEGYDFIAYQDRSGAINIELPFQMESEIDIFNTLGQQVFQNRYSDKNIAINTPLAQGIYLIKIQIGNSSVTKRLAIK